jgi:hypothetical protein
MLPDQNDLERMLASIDVTSPLPVNRCLRWLAREIARYIIYI